MHTRDDRLVPFALGQSLYDAAPDPKRFVQMAGGHNAYVPVDWESVLEQEGSGS